MQKNKAIIFIVGKQKKIKKEIFLNGGRIVFFERTRSVAWIAHQPSIKRWRAEGRGFKKPAIKVIVAWVSLRVQTIMNGIILKEAEFEEEPPSMGEFSLEQVLSIFLNTSKQSPTGFEASSELEGPKQESLESPAEERRYFVLVDEETDYFLPEVTKTESVKLIQFVGADYSFLEERNAAEIVISLKENSDSPYSLLYRCRVPEGEQDLLKV